PLFPYTTLFRSRRAPSPPRALPRSRSGRWLARPRRACPAARRRARPRRLQPVASPSARLRAAGAAGLPDPVAVLDPPALGDVSGLGERRREGVLVTLLELALHPRLDLRHVLVRNDALVLQVLLEVLHGILGEHVVLQQLPWHVLRRVVAGMAPPPER